MAYQPSHNDLACYSDVYKSAFGTRPRGELSWESQEDFDADFDSLVKYANEQEAREAAWQAQSYDKWITGLHKLARDTGNTLADVLRWQFDAEGLRLSSKFDREHFAHCNGFPSHAERIGKIR